MDEAKPSLKIGLLGCGVVGSHVANGLIKETDLLSRRAGATIELAGIAVKTEEEIKHSGLDPKLFTTNASELIGRCDIVVELIGGLEPARTFILEALNHGASVVTANKALLAAHGPELYAAADKSGVDLFFEASVGGAIPLLRPLRESLAGDSVQRILGIVNGTTNFVLDQMTKTGMPLDEAIAHAQRLGYAEADPTADITGQDAASKAAILASIAFDANVSIDDVYREGIENITTDDITWAKRTGHVVKLLAITERANDNAIIARVHPALVSVDHPLAAVAGAYNAVFVQTERAGNLMFYGQGAGGLPTSSAVLGDIVSAAHHRIVGGSGLNGANARTAKILPMSDAKTRYEIRLDIDDRPGVLAMVSTVLGEHGISIEIVRQEASTDTEEEDSVLEGDTSLLIVTHLHRDGDLAATVADLAKMDVVHAIRSALRVESV